MKLRWYVSEIMGQFMQCQHSAYERAAVPLGLLHLPISVSFAFFQEGYFAAMMHVM